MLPLSGPGFSLFEQNIPLAIAIVVTFSADHSAPLGFLTFGLYGVAAGAVLTAFAVRSPERGVGRGIRIALGLVTLIAGVVALAIDRLFRD